MEWHCAFPNTFPAVTSSPNDPKKYIKDKSFPPEGVAQSFRWYGVDLGHCRIEVMLGKAVRHGGAIYSG